MAGDKADTARRSADPAQKIQPEIPHILPHEKVFPIQIGSELFRLSGASISSDGTHYPFLPPPPFLSSSASPSPSRGASELQRSGNKTQTENPRAPSYFSSFFRCQLDKAAAAAAESSNGNGSGADGAGIDCNAIRTLYIDRDPGTFRDIAQHLQGYHIQPRDGAHFVRLFADAQFYQLPRLIDQLYNEPIYISVGGREFRIPKDLFSSPGDSPNYFTLGFGFLFSSPKEIFPGLEREGLLRPPSILPPAIPNRSAEIFEELLALLRGYEVTIRDETHRRMLLRDARYFHFRGLEQRLVPHRIGYNFLRRRHEIFMMLEDVKLSKLEVQMDEIEKPRGGRGFMGFAQYARPFCDDLHSELVVEIGEELMTLQFEGSHGPRAEFDSATLIRRLLNKVAQVGLLEGEGTVDSATVGTTETRRGVETVSVDLNDAHVTLDGKPWKWTEASLTTADQPQPHPPADYHSARATYHSSSAGKDLISGTSSDGPSGEGPPKKRQRTEVDRQIVDSTASDGAGVSAGAEVQDAPSRWAVQRGQWRIRVQRPHGSPHGVEVVLVGVKIVATSGEWGRNEAMEFLGG